MNQTPQSKKAGFLKTLLFLYIQSTNVQVYTIVFIVILTAMSIWSFMDLDSLLTENPQSVFYQSNKSFSSSTRRHSGLRESESVYSKKQSGLGSVPMLADINKTEFLRQYHREEYAGLVIHKFPKYLVHLDVPNKKQAFLNTLIPSVIIALKEVKAERQKLLNITQKMSFQPMMTISKEKTSWQSNLDKDEISFLLKMAKKYRSSEIAELVNKVKGYPVSLILAQGAIESSWGTSRFAVQGNNVFGVWTWGEKGIVPIGREEGKTHKVAVYDSILDSVRAYILTLNRHYAYDDLRKYRLHTSDSLVMAEGLHQYSERKGAYVDDVKEVIESNNLQFYDTFQLTATPDKGIEFADVNKQLANSTAQKRTKLPSI